jgi:hypothetical protein
MSNFLNEEIYEISIWEDELITPKREEAKEEEFLTGIYNPYYSYFEEKKVAIIGANDMESKYGAFGI